MYGYPQTPPLFLTHKRIYQKHYFVFFWFTAILLKVVDLKFFLAVEDYLVKVFKRMGEVTLGLPGPWADDNCEVADHYTTKIGGLPDWPCSNFKISPNLLECGACRSSLCLLAQVYAPISTKTLTVDERVLYVFGCVKPECGSDLSSWRVVRVQKSFGTEKLNLSRDEAVPSSSSSLLAPKSNQEDLWTFGSGDDDDDDDDDDIDLKELGRAFSEAATISCNTKKQTREHETSLKPSPITHRTQFADNTPVLPCFYTYTQEEKISKGVTSLYPELSSIHINENGSDLEDHACEEKWGEESYEYDKALNADRTYLKFKKRMDVYPEQCHRYSYGGKPLLATLEERDCGNCSHCNAPRHYEMQLMPPLLYFLQGATSGQKKIDLENWNWMTLIIYTCSKSCAESIHPENVDNQGWVVAEEAVIVQNE